MSNTAVRRLQKDYLQMVKDPVPFVTAVPNPSNILEWHYVVEGPPDSPYIGGYYHGVLTFPREYPFKPPSIRMLTPSGRFQPNVRLCLSISDYHPDTWNPSWTVGTILKGLLSFMLENSSTLGSIETTVETKRAFAAASIEFNLKNKEFNLCFPELTLTLRTRRDQEQNHDRVSCSSESQGSSNVAELQAQQGHSLESLKEGRQLSGGRGRFGLYFLAFSGLACVLLFAWLLHS